MCLNNEASAYWSEKKTSSFYNVSVAECNGKQCLENTEYAAVQKCEEKGGS